MPDDRTIEVYEQQADEWIADREPQDLDHVAWVDNERVAGPVADLGCGPGWNLSAVTPPRVGLDAAAAMLARVPDHARGTLRVRAGVERLPVAPGSLGGAVSNRVLLHLARHEVPTALADLHRALAPEAPVFIRSMGHATGRDERDNGPFAGRLFSAWAPDHFAEVCLGAGFTVDQIEQGPVEARYETFSLTVRLRRAHTLADTVGDGMRLLICGLNPSPYSADIGVGFGRPGNRFWPAAVAAGLTTTDRDPFWALRVDGIGMTDLVKRVTRRAAELEPGEYRDGLDRLERLCRWLQPRALCFVGLAGWRAAVDRRARPGVQVRTIGGRPVYLMPSTSGLNASATADGLADHLRQAAKLADRSGSDGTAGNVG